MPLMSAEASPVPNSLSPTQAWQFLKAGNKRFVHGELRARNPLAEREAVAYTQFPKAVVLTCGDSRIAPEIVFDAGLGELFVVRTAAGIADTIALGTIEFAVQAFQIPLVVVMAHQRCGAVTLACSGEKVTSPHMNRFIKAIRPLIPKRDLTPDGIEQVIRRNAMHVATDMTHRSVLLHDAVRQGELQVLAAYYWLDTGEVVRL